MEFLMLLDVFFTGWMLLWTPLWLLFIIGFVVAETESGAFWASVIFAGLCWIHIANPFTWAWNNLENIFQFSLFYIPIGIVWAFLRYFRKMRIIRSEYLDYKNGYIESNGQDSWEKHLEKVDYTIRNRYNPSLRDYQSRIMGWIFWWPFSIIDFFLSDFLKNIGKIVWDMVKNSFENIRRTALGEAYQDLKRRD